MIINNLLHIFAPLHCRFNKLVVKYICCFKLNELKHKIIFYLGHSKQYSTYLGKIKNFKPTYIININHRFWFTLEHKWFFLLCFYLNPAIFPNKKLPIFSLKNKILAISIRNIYSSVSVQAGRVCMGRGEDRLHISQDNKERIGENTYPTPSILYQYHITYVLYILCQWTTACPSIDNMMFGITERKFTKKVSLTCKHINFMFFVLIFMLRTYVCFVE